MSIQTDFLLLQSEATMTERISEDHHKRTFTRMGFKMHDHHQFTLDQLLLGFL